MIHLASLNLSVVIAVIACTIGGVMGGARFARPPGSTAHGRAEGRAFAGMLILAHAGTAMTLGYSPAMGRLMAGVLALGWLGAGLGRGLSLVMDRQSDPMLRQALIFEFLMALALGLPALGVGQASFGGVVEV